MQGRLSCASIFYGLYPRNLLAPECPEILLGPDLRARILHTAELSVLWHGPDLRAVIFHGLLLGLLCGLCLDILCGLYGLHLGMCILLGRPSQELI